MAVARDTHGTVFENGTAVLLARILDSSGDAVTAAGAALIEYSINEIDPLQINPATPIPGHSSVALSPASVLFDTLQSDALWTVDATGYNFRHEIDISTSEAFPKAGADYQVRYEVTPISGQKMVFRFHLKAI